MKKISILTKASESLEIVINSKLIENEHAGAVLDDINTELIKLKEQE